MILRDSLLELLKEKPINKIKPTELCRHADINRNTFYAHYSSPEDLLVSIENELYEQASQLVKDPAIVGDTRAFLTEIFHIIQDNKELCTILLSDFGDKQFMQKILELGHERSLADWTSAGIISWTEDMEMFYTFSVNGSVSAIQKWVLDGMKQTPEELAAFIHKSVFMGLQAFITQR